MQAWRTGILTVGGLGSLSLAAFLVHIVAGFVALGVALLLLEALTGPEKGAGR